MRRVYQTAQSRGVAQLPSHAISSYDEPPYQYRNGWAVNIPLRTKPDVIDELVPHLLKTNGDGGMLLSFSRLESVELGLYHEVILSVPCRFDLGKPDPLSGPGKPRNQIAGDFATYHPAFGCLATNEPSARMLSGQYIVAVYVDKAIPIAAGREIWGFPKQGAQIRYEEKAGVITASVEREGSTLIRASFTLAEEGSLADLQAVNWQVDTWFSLKLIPSIEAGMQHPDVAQLTCTNWQNLRVKRIFRGQGVVSFGISPTDPLHAIPVCHVEPGFYLQADSELTYGRVLYDYLAR